jgi:GT2 family glycosyltransferase
MIDVIVPVYKGAAETRRCIDSVLGNRQRVPFELVVVDDSSPDAGIVSLLDELAGRGHITLLRNEGNLGFVRSVNRGMSLHADRDVVLLNSDTEVANDWLDRLLRSATVQLDIGTATPFSNNATICSYPFQGWTGGMPGTLGLAALDNLFATTNAGRTVDLPTAVGFCMYIRRACLEEIGLFDAERFGRGYGEENDFCMRAAKAGWRNVLVGDVFVFHEGSVSFSDERLELTQTAGKMLLELHPNYVQLVRDFVILDPSGPLREAVDRARFACGMAEAEHVLNERSNERACLKSRLSEAEKSADNIESMIMKLQKGLAHAEALVAERDEEIARLRAAFSHAETLAFARTAELDRIHRFWLWKYMEFLMRRS